MARNRPRTLSAGSPTITAATTPTAVATTMASAHGRSSERSNRSKGTGMSLPWGQPENGEPPEPDEGVLAERQLAGPAGEHRHRQHHHGEHKDAGPSEQGTVGGERQAQKGEEPEQHHEPQGVEPADPPDGLEAAGDGPHAGCEGPRLLQAGTAGHQQYDDQYGQEEVDVHDGPVGRGDVAANELLGHAHRHPAGQRAWERSHAGQQRHHQHSQQQWLGDGRSAGLSRVDALQGGEEDGGRRCERSRDSPHDGRGPPGRSAVDPGGVRIRCRGSNRQPETRARDEPGQCSDEHGDHYQHHDLAGLQEDVVSGRPRGLERRRNWTRGNDFWEADLRERHYLTHTYGGDQHH